MTYEVLRFVAAMGAILVAARVLGALAKRVGQPAISGEILAGVLLGPTALGLVAPTPALDVAGKIAVVLFLLAAGMEVDLSTLRREQRTAFLVGVSGIVFPFALGFGVAWFAPDALSLDTTGDPMRGAMFLGIALSISALPVIVRTLQNIGLYRTPFGTSVVAAALLDDMVGWMLFGLLLAPLGVGAQGSAHGGPGPLWTIVAEVALAILLLSVFRRAVDRALSRAAPRVGGIGVAVMAAAATLAICATGRWTGVNAMFAAFVTGIAIGDSAHVPDRSRAIVAGGGERWVAPLFFGAIGLRVDFATHFDAELCAVVLALACAAKLLGCFLGARCAGLPSRTAWAFGFAMNSRGAMEIVLGAAALEAGIVGPRMFVALVVMAIVTSVVAGPAITRLMRAPAASRDGR